MHSSSKTSLQTWPQTKIQLHQCAILGRFTINYIHKERWKQGKRKKEAFKLWNTSVGTGVFTCLHFSVFPNDLQCVWKQWEQEMVNDYCTSRFPYFIDNNGRVRWCVFASFWLWLITNPKAGNVSTCVTPSQWYLRLDQTQSTSVFQKVTASWIFWDLGFN